MGGTDDACGDRLSYFEMKLGFVGTGTITAAMVAGLQAAGARHAICLSPRSKDVADGLAGQFDNVTVAGSNQDVIDSCENVVIAVRPQVAEEVLRELRFTAGHHVISLVAGFSVGRIAGLVAPAERVWRAIPLPAAAKRRSPTAFFPPGGVAGELFAMLGSAFPIETEEKLCAFSTATSTMATYFHFMREMASWMAREGVPGPQAREYVALLFAGLADTGMQAAQRSFEELSDAHATRGGLNEQLLRDMTNRGVFDMLSEGLDAVHRRVTGR